MGRIDHYLSGSLRFLVCLLVLLLIGIVGGLVYIPFALGEEVGWRGFMEKNVRLAKVKKYLFIGAVWGVWHTPLILIGCLLGILMMMVVCISLSYYFSLALHGTRSLMVPTIMHGLINASSVIVLFKLGNPLLGLRIGMVFVFAFWSLLLIDYIVRKLVSYKRHKHEKINFTKLI